MGRTQTPMRDFCDVGAKLHIKEDGSGEPVILIHGLTLDSRMWQPQVGPLSALFRVIRYDLRGFGKSADPPPIVPYRDRNDLAALLDAMDISSGHLVALSRAAASPWSLRCIIPAASVAWCLSTLRCASGTDHSPRMIPFLRSAWEAMSWYGSRDSLRRGRTG
jgi:pimeloyl-ACP methyl ester carboxylesterase